MGEFEMTEDNSKILVSNLIEIKKDIRTIAYWVMFLGAVVIIELFALFIIIYVLVNLF